MPEAGILEKVLYAKDRGVGEKGFISESSDL
jgi:hypothetical protein